jgi:regulator of protease activity HflC (stomatin/prohibitin superfamily)
MTKSIALIVGLVLLVALVLFSMTYTVNFHEVAIKTRFGREGKIVADAGLHVKLPLIADKITKIDTRLQLRESPLETIQTSDGQQLVVRAFMMWKVNEKVDENSSGPLDFHKSFPSGVEEANQAIIDQFRTALRLGMSRYAFDELIGPSSRIEKAEQAIKAEMVALTQSRGIEPVSVGISQLLLPPKTTTAVLSRMQATRKNISEIERDKGSAVATGIDSKARADADKIRTFAQQRAAEIRTAGKKNEAFYMAQMNQEKGLAIFLNWLDALESTLSRNTTVVIPTAFSPFHILQLNTPTDGQGIPVPTAGDAPLAPPARSPREARREGEPSPDGDETEPAKARAQANETSP